MAPASNYIPALNGLRLFAISVIQEANRVFEGAIPECQVKAKIEVADCK